MAIYFIRHGQSEFNAAYQGAADPFIFDAPLTELGFRQAADTRTNIWIWKLHASSRHHLHAPFKLLRRFLMELQLLKSGMRNQLS
ncbi:histidine phosphatase family protein [Jannaschia helgolandensis]|uniref:histidine phosphatase family protein n=1 Tax=Jannaschia helgolandensis TaxID=188906 RepID=UPI0011137114